MNPFLRQHAKFVSGMVRGWDRLRFRGTLQKLCHAQGMDAFMRLGGRERVRRPARVPPCPAPLSARLPLLHAPGLRPDARAASDLAAVRPVHLHQRARVAGQEPGGGGDAQQVPAHGQLLRATGRRGGRTAPARCPGPVRLEAGAGRDRPMGRPDPRGAAVAIPHGLLLDDRRERVGDRLHVQQRHRPVAPADDLRHVLCNLQNCKNKKLFPLPDPENAIRFTYSISTAHHRL
jgi:hypothetical protein